MTNVLTLRHVGLFNKFCSHARDFHSADQTLASMDEAFFRVTVEKLKWNFISLTESGGLKFHTAIILH